MWHAQIEDVAGGQRYSLYQDDAPLAFEDLFDLLEHDLAFGRWYTRLLADSRDDAFFWEHPPLCTATYDDPAQFVLIDGPALVALQPDPRPFERQFTAVGHDDVVSFPNLGGDAVLVAPRPIGSPLVYAHLAAFIRQGPPDQVLNTWQRTARVVRENLNEQPTWLSTAGLGVPWLHLRLDQRPKYYRFEPFRSPPSGSP